MFSLRYAAPCLTALGIGAEGLRVNLLRNRKEEGIHKLAGFYREISQRDDLHDFRVQQGFIAKVDYCTIDKDMKKSFIYKIASYLCSRKTLDNFFKDAAFEQMISSSPLSLAEQRGLIFDPHGWNSAEELACQKMVRDEQYAAELLNRSTHLRVNLLINSHKLLKRTCKDLEEKGYEDLILKKFDGFTQRALGTLIHKLFMHSLKSFALAEHAVHVDEVKHTLSEIEEFEEHFRDYLQPCDPQKFIEGCSRPEIMETIEKIKLNHQIFSEMNTQATQEMMNQLDAQGQNFAEKKEFFKRLDERNAEIPEDFDTGFTEEAMETLGKGLAEPSKIMIEICISNILETQWAILKAK